MNAIHGKNKVPHDSSPLRTNHNRSNIYAPTIQNKRWRNKERIRKEIMNNYGQLCCPLTVGLCSMKKKAMRYCVH